MQREAPRRCLHVAGAFRDPGPNRVDAVWVRDWQPAAADKTILQKALDEARSVVTLDRDIPALVLRSGQAKPSVVRLVRLSTRAQIPALLEALKRHGDDLANGALMTVSPQNIRIRRLAG